MPCPPESLTIECVRMSTISFHFHNGPREIQARSSYPPFSKQKQTQSKQGRATDPGCHQAKRVPCESSTSLRLGLKWVFFANFIYLTYIPTYSKKTEVSYFFFS